MSAKFIKTTLLPTSLSLGLVLLFAWTQYTKPQYLSGIEERLEYMFYDLRLNVGLSSELWKAEQQAQDDFAPKVVIIDIDERSLTQEGRWPWPRSRIAELTDTLFDAGTLIVGYDIFFSEEERNDALTVLHQIEASGDHPGLQQALSDLAPQFDNNSRLARSLADRDTVLGYLFHDDESVTAVGALPQPLLTADEGGRYTTILQTPNFTGTIPTLQAAAAAGGFVTAERDRDGIIRRTPMVVRYNNAIYGSLSLRVAMLYLFTDQVEIVAPQGDQPQDSANKIIIADREIPIDITGFSLVPYQGPRHTIPYISAADILAGRIDETALENTIAIIGASAIGIGDLVATPTNNVYPGVEVHASMVQGILDNNFYKEPWDHATNMVTTLVVGVLLALLLPNLGPIWLFLVSTAVGSGLILWNFWLWQAQNSALSMAWTLAMIFALFAVNMIYGFMREHRKRTRLQDNFGQYIPPQLVARMDDSDSYGIKGESREMTVLFADIRGFTTLSEQLSPEALRTLLNRYFTEMTKIIFEHEGTIDKYVGDMVMAFWGAPIKQEDHAVRAMRAAMAMLAKTAELKPQLMSEGYPEINIGVGLSSGPMNVGDMGSNYRRAYTVLGDNVNLGSRIEGLTKLYGTGLVISEATYRQQSEFLCRRLDKVQVKGKTEGITVYHPLCRREDADAELLLELAEHEEGLEAFYQRDWRSAEMTFAKLAKEHPQTRIYQIYLERITQLKMTPPHDAWDGVFIRNEK